eukprot:TRINITY_DN45045_c0_g1_i1.p1 TRINITY_DN45045_c0_g1~~TRINITY_DN45045_c0_g1_i1.p1  ORF type:complete len:473 (-),score=67.90 TRINITY_DN45045_c0_g1_i1:249-1598(-)
MAQPVRKHMSFPRRQRLATAGATAEGKRACFFKTKICAFWQAGRCQRGAACKYAHGDTELMEEPDLRKTAMCQKLMRGEGCNDSMCSFAHNLHELRSRRTNPEEPMCPCLTRCKELGVRCIYAYSQQKLVRGNANNISSAALEEASSDDDDLQTEFEFAVHPAFDRAVTMPNAAGCSSLDDHGRGFRGSSAYDEDLQTEFEFESDESTGFCRSVTMPAALGQQAFSALPVGAAATAKPLGFETTSTPWLRQAGASCEGPSFKPSSLQSSPPTSLESGCNGLPTGSNSAFGLNQSEAWLRQLSISTAASYPETLSPNSLPPVAFESGCKGSSIGSSAAEFALSPWGVAGFDSPSKSRSGEHSESWPTQTSRQTSADSDAVPLEAPDSHSLPQMTYAQADSSGSGFGGLAGLPVGHLVVAMPIFMFPVSVPASDQLSGTLDTSIKSKMTRW